MMIHLRKLPVFNYKLLTIIALFVSLLLCAAAPQAIAQNNKKSSKKFKSIKEKEKERGKKAEKAFDPKPRWPKKKRRKVKPPKTRKGSKVKKSKFDNPPKPREGTAVQESQFNNPPRPRKNFTPKRIEGKRAPEELRSAPRKPSKVVDMPFSDPPAPREDVKADRYKEFLIKQRQGGPPPLPEDEAFTDRARRHSAYDRRIHGDPQDRRHQPYWMNSTLRDRYGGVKGYFLGSKKRKNREKELKKKNKEFTSFQGRYKYKSWTPKGRESLYKKKLKQTANFQGRFLDFTKAGKEKFYKKRAKAFADFESPSMKRKKPKNLHPSAAHMNVNTHSSYKKKERIRKWWKRWFRWKKNADQPQHLKEKRKKPKYDTKESEIWYD